MGWERKRGKLEELNRLLRSADRHGFSVEVGDLSILPVGALRLTLDADTRLPAGRRANPDRHPRASAQSAGGRRRARRRVTEGYGILQPRVSVNLTSAAGSLFARIYAGHTGVDPYTTAVSDTYQDLFGEGVFTGKGLYDVDAFQAAVGWRVPENALLSHDLFEGLSRAHGARLRRRGGRRLSRQRPRACAAAAPLGARRLADPRLALPAGADAHGSGRRIACRSSASGRSSTTCGAVWCAPALLAFFAAAWTVLPGQPSRVDPRRARRGRVPARRLALPAPQPRPPHEPARVHLRGVVEDLGTALRAGAADAGLPAIPRLGDGARHRPDACPAGLHAAPPARVGDGRRAGGAGRRRCCGRDAFLLRARWSRARSRRWRSLALVERRSSRRAGARAAVPRRCGRRRPPAPTGSAAPSRRAAGAVARGPRAAHGRGAEDLGVLRRPSPGPRITGCRPTTSRRSREPAVAHRTSPTNIGLGLLATLAAHDSGLIPADAMVERLDRTLTTVEGLERHEGHLLNWYDTQSSRRFCRATSRRWTAAISPGRSSPSPQGAGELASVATPQLASRLSDLGRSRARRAGGRHELRASSTIGGASSSSIGYRLADAGGPGRRDESYYDLLASEARLASFFAIAKGDVPQSHWFHLGRLVVSVDGVPTLVSWSATMFEYLMPLLLMRTLSRDAPRPELPHGRAASRSDTAASGTCRGASPSRPTIWSTGSATTSTRSSVSRAWG